MYAKLEITGILNVQTGLHIGGSEAFAAIGAVDSPVVRDPISNQPMIPGSSLKGKVRALLARKYNTSPLVSSCDQDAEPILRLFGNTAVKKKPQRSRVLFRDLQLKNLAELRGQGADSATEVKFENGIDRLTAVANPRQIERVIRGSRFGLELVYTIENGAEAEAASDLKLLAEGLRLLQYDYLGGHGSRGYGRVTVEDLALSPVVGEIPADLLNACRAALEEAQA